MKHSWTSLMCLGFAGLCLFGCDPLPRKGLVGAIVSPQLAAAMAPKAPAAPPPPPKKRVTKRAANTRGKILILEYHKLSGKNTLLDRTPASFRKDLERLYKQGYRPVTVTEWLDNKMDLAPGASPVILTFDDAHESQFILTKEGKVSASCFVGIWEKFAGEHPDFPVKGTFFVLPPYPFGQKHFVKKKIEMLQSMGSEIASHTYHHKNLSKQTDATVKAEIATSLEWLKQFGVTSTTVAFPYGNRPKNMKLMEGFTWNGKEYKVRCSFLAAGEPSEPIDSKTFSRWQIPRVVACENEGGSTYWLNVMKHGKHYTPYVAP